MPDPDTESSSTSSDVFTETTHRSWGRKLTDSLKGVVVGAILVVCSGVGMFWNEGRSAQTINSLAEGRGAVVEVETARVLPENEGKLVHLVGDLRTTAPLTDPEFAVSVQASRLVRHVEMYQWHQEEKEETRKEVGGGETTVKTYTYVKKWADQAIDSSRFRQPSGHTNPPMLFRGKSITAQDATLGAFRPGATPLSALAAREPFVADQALAAQLQPKLGKPVQVVDGTIYVSANPTAPAVGDVRVSYTIAANGTTSLLGRQAGTDILPYATKAGDSLLFARLGNVSADEMFKDAARLNTFITWLLRFMAAVFMFAGFSLLLGPLVALGDVLPFLGNLLQAGTGLIALLATAIVAPVVIAIAWFYYRPLVSVIALVVGLGLVVLIRMMAKRRAGAKGAALAPHPATAR